MKRKEFFNFGLYLEGLRRVRLPGIIFFVIMTLEAVLIPIGNLIDEYAYKMRVLEMGEKYIPTPYSISAVEAHPFIIASFIIIVPVLTWTLFSFLNKRNASDFYHSLPHTRLAVYVSTTASLATWILGLILIPAGISRVLLECFPDVFSVVPGSYTSIILGCIAASFLLASIIIVAMCITGTIFTNVIITALITFFPRYIILFITTAVSDVFPLVPFEYVSKFLSLDINILTGLSIGNFVGYGFGELDCLTNISSQIYTLALAVIYLVIGYVLFYRRKSESADRSAPSRFMQSIYRIAITMVICVPICYLIFVNEFFYAEEYFVVIVLYLIAAIAYFLYELITTRKWKNLIRALPGLGIVALLNVALLLTISGITAVEKNFSPDAEDIEYIQIVENNPGSGKYMSFFEFAQAEASSVKIKDEAALKVVAESLADTIKYNEEKGSLNVVYDSYYYEDSKSFVDYTTYTFKIKAGHTTKYRTIRVNNSDIEIIMSALSNAHGYADSWLLLPEPQRGTISIDIGDISIDNDQASAFFKIMKDEVASLDFEEWYEFLSGEIYDVLSSVTYTTNGTTIYIPISSTLLPKTTEAYFEIMVENPGESAEDMLALMSEDSEREVEFSYSEIYFCGENGVYRKYYFGVNMYDNKQNLKLLSECIDTEEPKTGDDFIILNLYEIIEVEYDDEGFVYYQEEKNHHAILKLKDGAEDKLAPYIPEYNSDVIK